MFLLILFISLFILMVVEHRIITRQKLKLVDTFIIMLLAMMFVVIPPLGVFLVVVMGVDVYLGIIKKTSLKHYLESCVDNLNKIIDNFLSKHN